MFNDILRHRSGRVIALARAVLAAVFLFAIWIDPSQPVQATGATYAILGAYVVAATALAILTWNGWWLDARLAALAHAIDIALFALLVLVTDGYTSPFFVFFVFILLSAAIRWGWRQTALTAFVVMLLFFAIGLTVAHPTEVDFDLQRFIIRSANLLILSALLIWFGVNHGFSAAAGRDDLMGDLPPAADPLDSVLAAAAAATGASAALLLWREAGSPGLHQIVLRNGRIERLGTRETGGGFARTPLLFDLANDCALSRRPNQRFRFSGARKLFDRDLMAECGIAEGLAVPVRSAAGGGLLVLGGIDGLCTDHIELGEKLSAEVAEHIQRHALFAAMERGAKATARLSLARDLHDSIVQFLAGATFRVEAISRSLRQGERPEAELGNLKLLLLEEQQELRSAIGALRGERIALPALAVDLEVLCGRLARQWDINCNFSADVGDASAPMRLHLDAHQLVREAVANAVRHAGAKDIKVRMTCGDGGLQLDIGSDGRGSERLMEKQPWSLRERVNEVNGTLTLASRSTGTTVCITLPLKEELRA